jgi:hypothetical protein
MVAERQQNNSRPPWEELSPGVRDAVRYVVGDPPPGDMTHRALVILRRQVARYPRNRRRRIITWAAPAIAASIALLALTAYFQASQTGSDRLSRSLLHLAADDTATAFADDVPTAWAFAKAARTSPDALVVLNAMLDRQSRQSISANSRFLAITGVTPFVPDHAGTVP